MSFVITGATGQLGNLVVQNLLERGVKAGDIVATGRSLDRLEALRALGLRTAVLDYNNPADGVINAGDTVLLISGSEVGQRIAQHGNVVAATKAAGAARIVYTSVVGADATSLLVAPEHAATEDAIKDSGLAYTFLRNGWYHDNYQPPSNRPARPASSSQAHRRAACRAPRAPTTRRPPPSCSSATDTTTRPTNSAGTPPGP